MLRPWLTAPGQCLTRPKLGLFRTIAPGPIGFVLHTRIHRPELGVPKLSLLVRRSSNRLPTIANWTGECMEFLCDWWCGRASLSHEAGEQDASSWGGPEVPARPLTVTAGPATGASLIRRRFSMAVCYAKIEIPTRILCRWTRQSRSGRVGTRIHSGKCT
jgi:hypothetical protein